jgi:hypothetical protein
VKQKFDAQGPGWSESVGHNSVRVSISRDKLRPHDAT